MVARRVAFGVALISLSGLSAARAGVIVVDPQGAPGFPLLQSALSAALDGDILLVKAGTYTPTSGVNKLQVAGVGLVVVNDSGASVKLPALAIAGVPGGSTFVLRGFEIQSTNDSIAALAVSQSDGAIWIEDCVVTGAKGWPTLILPTPGGLAISAKDVAGLVIERSTVRGGQGGYDPAPGHYVNGGGSACVVENAAVAIHQSTFEGGDSGFYGFGSTGGPAYGGDGIVVGTGADVMIAGSNLVGGDSLTVVSTVPGPTDPGSGLVVSGGTVRFRASVASAGTTVNLQTSPAIDDPAGAVTNSWTPARSIQIASPVRSGQIASYQVNGLAYDAVVVFIGSPSVPTPHVAHEGSFMFALSAFVGPVAFGVIPMNGLLSGSAVAPPLPPSVDGATLVLQAVIASSGIPTLEAATLYVQVGPNF